MADASQHPPGSEPARIAALIADQLGAAVQGVAPLAGGIGTRAFYRVTLGGPPGSVIARVEHPEDPRGRPEGIPPEPGLEPLRGFLAGAGLPVPERLGGDAAGIDLLEDLGDRTLADAVARAPGEARRALYRQVLDWIPVLQRLGDPPGGLPAFARRLGPAHYRYKGELFARYGLGAATPAARRALRDAFVAIGAALADAPLRLAHRDLQSQNVLIHRERPYMIDVQGALLAPPEYDLVALLRDSYVVLPETEVAEHLVALRPQLPDSPDPALFAERFDLLTVSRKGKDLARFVYAARERGDTRFLPFLSHTWRLLLAAAERLADGDRRWGELAELLAEGGPPCAG